MYRAQCINCRHFLCRRQFMHRILKMRINKCLCVIAHACWTKPNNSTSIPVCNLFYAPNSTPEPYLPCSPLHVIYRKLIRHCYSIYLIRVPEWKPESYQKDTGRFWKWYTSTVDTVYDSVGRWAVRTNWVNEKTRSPGQEEMASAWKTAMATHLVPGAFLAGKVWRLK